MHALDCAMNNHFTPIPYIDQKEAPCMNMVVHNNQYAKGLFIY